MRAVVVTGYGDLSKLELREIDTPSIAPTEVLVRVKATSVNPIDWKLRKGDMRFIWPLKFPFTPGFDVAGIVESVGANVDAWKSGDRLFAALPKGGGYAEYVAVDASLCATAPQSLSFEEAASVPGAALSALQALRNVADAQAGHHVIVNGASGGVGSFAVQIATALGCQVTAVASTANEDLVRSLGAQQFVDYTQDDVTNYGPCDVFLDVVPNRSFRSASKLLTKTGIYVTTLPGAGPLVWKVLTLAGRVIGFRKRCGWLIIKPDSDDLRVICDMISNGQVRPILQRAYPLDEARQANAQSETGHAAGKIVLNVS